MAITLALAVLFATLVTLALVPIRCVILKEVASQKLMDSATENALIKPIQSDNLAPLYKALLL